MLALDRAVAAAMAIVIAADVSPAAESGPGGIEVAEGERLSAGQLVVLGLVAEVRPGGELAGTLFVSHRTVSTHVTNIFNKLGVSSRSAAAAYAIRHNLV